MNLTTLIVLVLLGLVVLLLAWGVVRVFLPSRLPRVRDPACARCLYPVQGLGDWRCPECGTDLRVGGVVTPELRHRARASMVGGVVSWVLLMLVVGGAAALLLIPRMVQEVRRQASVSATTMSFYSGSGQYRGLEYTMRTTDPGDGTPPTVARTLALPFGEALALESDQVTPEAVLDWMAQQGVDTTSERVKAEAGEVARVIGSSGAGRIVSGRVFRQVSASTMSQASGPVRYGYEIDPWLWVIAGGWLVLLVGGVIGLVAARRAQGRRARTPGMREADAPAVMVDPSA